MKDTGGDRELVDTFYDETSSRISLLNEKLLEVESGRSDLEMINEMFRAAHSIKGMAGFLNFTGISKITHSMETVLDKIRKSEAKFTPDIIDTLFKGFDAVLGLLDQTRASGSDSGDFEWIINVLDSSIKTDKKEEEGDVDAEFAMLPEFLKGHFSFDDALEALVARNSGKRVSVIHLSFKKLFSENLDPVKTYNDIELAVHVQSVVPVRKTNESPWQPVGEYDYHVAILCFHGEHIKDALTNVRLPRCEAWELCDPSLKQNLSVIESASGIVAPNDKTTLQVRQEMRRHLSLWMSETGEELDQLDKKILEYEKEPSNAAHVNEMFRLMHRIKGSSANMGLDEMSRAAHNCESILSPLREGAMAPDASFFQLFYNVKDFLSECLRRVVDGEEEAPDSSAMDACMDELLAKEKTQGELTTKAAENWELELGEEENKAAARCAAAGRTVWKIDVELYPGAKLADVRCCMLLKSLGGIGEVIASTPTMAELGSGLDRIDRLRIVFAGKNDQPGIHRVLEMDMVSRIDMVRMSFAEQQPEAKKEAPKAAAQDAPAGGGMPSTLDSRASDTVRVETSRLDSLLNAAGELAITKARITQLSESLFALFRSMDADALETTLKALRRAAEGGARGGRGVPVEHLSKLDAMLSSMRKAQNNAQDLRDVSIVLHRHTSLVQNFSMQMRMVPVGPLFQRFHRLIRDVSKQRNKSARLVLEGEGTELDKKLIDELADPLTHMIRNSVDHGLEEPEERKKAGKPEEGTVWLDAYHEGSQICIRIRDDGKGLDVGRIREKAVENGLMSREEAARLSDADATQLIFRPGFSTAKQVTNISGRGVGMDIVKSKITELKGKVDITTEWGRGTTFVIRLPLTLAMIKALLVEISGARYALPLESVREIIDISPERTHRVEGRDQVIFLREALLPIVNLSETIGLRKCVDTGKGGFVGVVARGARDSFVIPVDRVIGEDEIVVKGLSQEFSSVRGVAGATIMGDGGVALILDSMSISERGAD